MRNYHQSTNKIKGFTLLELLVVMVIIGLLVSYVGPKYFSQLSKSEVKTAKAQIHALKKALDIYRLDNGAYPNQESGLEALVNAPQGNGKWKGPYLEKGVPNDPWDHAYIYRIPGENAEFDLFSYGADGRSGGTDENADISD
ncbi:MAG: type II secretion system major pseudopilin GspG [Methylotenera sp.]|uniref:type II secretion system major pseudopilin GspG n=1 Tax=Methylotenera sp. TaxID=2051956 RepID=UPI0017A8A0EF|nr:type II secretion system major pseudopilin GspG [Methylotenera sp.]NOU25062.1 type II secretion system major pseudopilin GspG [Methylotenera sp.]